MAFARFLTRSCKFLNSSLFEQFPIGICHFSDQVTNDATEKGNERFRHQYSLELEGALNRQIHNELNASLVYLSIACYYGRTDIALPGCKAYFMKMYDEEQTHAKDFIEYQLLRGGHITLFPITVPENQDWTDITIAFGISLEMEKTVKEQLMELLELAECQKDMQLVDMLSGKYMQEQNESINEIGRLLTRANRLVLTGGVGRHLFDKEIYHYVEKKFPAFIQNSYI